MISEEKATFQIKQEEGWSYLEKTQGMWTWTGVIETTGFRSKGGTTNQIAEVNVD